MVACTDLSEGESIKAAKLLLTFGASADGHTKVRGVHSVEVL